MKNLQNKIALITGASSGIGAACAKYFAEFKTHLILCGRRIDLLQALAKELQIENAIDTYCLQYDVRSYAEVKTAIQNLPPKWQKIDILVNNAGMALGKDLVQESDIEDWNIMIDTNLKGLLNVTNLILPSMVKNNNGHIINIGSIAGHYVYPRLAVYAATKFAVNAFTTGLRTDLIGTKVRVTTIDPGAVKTDFNRVRYRGDIAAADGVYDYLDALTPEDIADAVIYSASRPDHVNINEIIIMHRDQASIATLNKKIVDG